MKSARTLGIAALFVLVLIYGITPVMARFFSSHLGVYEQWYLRFFVAACVMALFFRKNIRFRKLLTHSRYEIWLAVVRGALGLGVGAILYALSTKYTTIGSVTAMQIVPFTAVFGVVLLRERLGFSRALLIGVSFVGAFLVAVQDIANLRFGFGELLSLISGAFFSLSFVLRRKQTGEMNNYELAFMATLVGMCINYLMAVITTGHFLPTQVGGSVGLMFWCLLLTAGVLSAAMNMLSNYGFEQVRATTASIIMNMELVFGVVLGYLVYREVLTVRQTVGALVILLASSIAAYLEAKQVPEQNIDRTTKATETSGGNT